MRASFRIPYSELAHDVEWLSKLIQYLHLQPWAPAWLCLMRPTRACDGKHVMEVQAGKAANMYTKFVCTAHWVSVPLAAQ